MITLTEAEYYKLAKLSQDVQLATMAARLAVGEKEAARNAYMDALAKTYPDLDFKGTHYLGDDERWTLTPQEKKP
jgi:hypothetical protein